MKKTIHDTVILNSIILLLLVPVLLYAQHSPTVKVSDSRHREIVIEDFEDGSIELQSYPGEDEDPNSWQLNTNITYQNSQYSLRLFGNTWKIQFIDPITINSGDVWQVAAYVATNAEIQGFGIVDSEYALLYSFTGTEEVTGDGWVPVYQGYFPEDQWNIYQLPIADDWFDLFGYLPEVVGLVYFNDKDDTSQGNVYFDQIVDITDDLPIVPQVSVSYTIQGSPGSKNGKSMLVQFSSFVIDPDSPSHSYYWDFGDGATSTDQNPQHLFNVTDDHPYTVLLKVSDNTNRWGYASCKVPVDPGNSTLPVTLNFVGDIMLARDYENPGGIIPTQGVEAIFEPTLPWLGEAADITVANLECVFTTSYQHHPTKPIYFKASPGNLTGLTFAGIDIVNLANNHILDYMLPGLQDTQEHLAEQNILFSGAGANSEEAYLPVFCSKSGISFAFLAASDRTGQYNNYQPYLNAGYNKPGFANLTPYYFQKQINEVSNISDLLVLEWHSGTEYSIIPGLNPDSDSAYSGNLPYDEDYSPLEVAPSRSNRSIRQLAIDKGADIVICHHSHIAQGIEIYRGKLIAHSLGNFTFDLPYPETMPSLILNAKADESGFYEFSVTPVFIDDFIPGRAEGELGLHILDYLAQKSRDLDTYLIVDRENVIATVLVDTVNMITYEVENTIHLPLFPGNGKWVTAPLKFDKTGNLSSLNLIEPQDSYEYRLGREWIWFGNMEDEGCTLWNMNNSNEVYCDTVAYAGDRSIQHKRQYNSTSNLITNLEGRIECNTVTQNFSICGYIRTLNGANVTIEVQYYDAFEGGTPVASENIGVEIDGTTPWTFYYHELTFPVDTGYFDIRLSSGVPNSGTAYSWFDNVSLVCWDNWKEFTPSQTVTAPNDYYFLQVRSDQNQGMISVNYTESTYHEYIVGEPQPELQAGSICELMQNSPNPFNPENGPTLMPFKLDQESRVKITVFDLNGQIVRTLADGDFSHGKHTLVWDGSNERGQPVGHGIYFYRIETGGFSQVKKCILMRL